GVCGDDHRSNKRLAGAPASTPFPVRDEPWFRHVFLTGCSRGYWFSTGDELCLLAGCDFLCGARAGFPEGGTQFLKAKNNLNNLVMKIAAGNGISLTKYNVSYL